MGEHVGLALIHDDDDDYDDHNDDDNLFHPKWPCMCFRVKAVLVASFSASVVKCICAMGTYSAASDDTQV